MEWTKKNLNRNSLLFYKLLLPLTIDGIFSIGL